MVPLSNHIAVQVVIDRERPKLDLKVCLGQDYCPYGP